MLTFRTFRTDEQRCKAIKMLMRHYRQELVPYAQILADSGSVSIEDFDAFVDQGAMPCGITDFIDFQDLDMLMIYVQALLDVVLAVVDELTLNPKPKESVYERSTTPTDCSEGRLPDDSRLYVFPMVAYHFRFLMVGGVDIINKKVFNMVASVIVAAANKIRHSDYEVSKDLRGGVDILVPALRLCKVCVSDFKGTPGLNSMRTNATMLGHKLQTFDEATVNKKRSVKNAHVKNWVAIPSVAFSGVLVRDEAFLGKVKDLFLNPQAAVSSPKRRGPKPSPKKRDPKPSPSPKRKAAKLA